MSLLDKLTGKLAGDGYQARALRGTALTFLSFGGQNFLRLASNLVLTRLLFPEAFGLMALVQVVLAGAVMFSDLGIRGSIVQDERGNDPAFLNTAWTMQIGRGILLWGVISLLAAPMSRFYEAPQLAELLLVSAFVPMIQGFNSTKMATASRTLQLGRMTFMALGAQLAGIIVMVALAYALESVWALVIGSLVSPAIIAVLSHFVLKGHQNTIGFEREAFSRLFKFGRYIFIATLASFFVRQGDNAILGKFVSLEDLAIYRIGFFLAAVPASLSLAVGDKVIFPLYARRPPADNPSNKRKIDRARFLVTGGLMAAAAFLALTGDWLIRFLYDPRYHAAGPVLVLIAVFSLPMLITHSYFKLPLASGQSGRYATMMITSALTQMTLLLILVPTYGLLGAAASPGLAAILTYPLLIWIIRPFKGWDPVHDTVFALAWLAIGAVAFWINWDVIVPLFTPV